MQLYLLTIIFHLEKESDCPSKEYPSPCVVMVVRGWIFSHTRSLALSPTHASSTVESPPLF